MVKRNNRRLFILSLERLRGSFCFLRRSSIPSLPLWLIKFAEMAGRREKRESQSLGKSWRSPEGFTQAWDEKHTFTRLEKALNSKVWTKVLGLKVNLILTWQAFYVLPWPSAKVAVYLKSNRDLLLVSQASPVVQEHRGKKLFSTSQPQLRTAKNSGAREVFNRDMAITPFVRENAAPL